VAFVGFVGLQGPVAIRFDSLESGKPPAGFTSAHTGPGPAPTWVVTEDPTAPGGGRVLAQTDTDETNGRFPLCVFDGWSGKDLSVSVRFRAVSGQIDRAAGLVARYRDKDNYYVVRANALEDNVRLYRVVRGKRIQFAGADHVKVTEKEWHSLGLDVVGRQFRVLYDGKLLFEAEDETFVDAGKVGLWTKADSVTHFDDLVVDDRKGGDAPPSRTRARAAFDFEDTEIGGLPRGLTAPTSGEGAATKWRVIEDPKAPVGKHVVTSEGDAESGASSSRGAQASGGAGGGRRAALLLADGVVAKNLVLRVAFRTLSPPSSSDAGRRIAGVVLRYKDADDNCAIRINTREDNVQLHRTLGKKRTQLGEIHHRTIAEGEWHVLEVRAQDERIRVLCDGDLLFEGRDEGAVSNGKVGLVGSSDGTTLYDDLVIESTDAG